MRGFAKDSIRQNRGVDLGPDESLSASRMTESELKKGTKRSKAIDRKLKEHAGMMLRECKVLVYGDSDSGKTTILRQMRIIHGTGRILNNVAKYRDRVRMTALEAMCTAIEGLAESRFEIEDENDQKRAAAVLLQYQSNPTEMDVAVGESISSLWHSLGDTMRNRAVNMADSAP
jgi:hypothetical protein